uniref:Uncharacterized protein n=1 Tax=Pipistrellus kuhlii TaxID=59472 RepID=A0A7J7Y925_PIPKU|nr:hypothetical protein mPipKuh1_010287 [Pipistrellus kuhlii]
MELCFQTGKSLRWLSCPGGAGPAGYSGQSSAFVWAVASPSPGCKSGRKGYSMACVPRGPGCEAALVSCPHRAGESPRDLCPSLQSSYNNPQRRQTSWRSDYCWGLADRSLPIIPVPGNTGSDKAAIIIFSSPVVGKLISQQSQISTVQ